jgi:hypothetical protein
VIVNRLQRLLARYATLREWNIGLLELTPQDLEALVTEGRLGKVIWCPRVTPLSSRADPFVWSLDGDARVIFEDVDHWNAMGRIRSLPLAAFTRPQPARAEIVRPYHLSYPHVVCVDDIWYCTPESARGGGLDLYAWNPQTESWECRRRLIDGIPVLDGTLFRHGAIWYLFGAIRGDGSYDRLYIWWSRSLEGEWSMHARSPAKVDICSARSAGPVFRVGDRWYRPAQDCSEGYGRAITINRIEVLTPTEFVETRMSRLQPDPKGPYPDGLHTLTIHGSVALIDGRRMRLSVALLAMKLARGLVRAIGPSRDRFGADEP